MNEADFAAALLDPDRPAPADLLGPDGKLAERRFAVYRNNVAVGLTDVLTAAFPVVEKLVGVEFFVAMAGQFLRLHLPQSRIMMLYGAEFTDFLAGFPPVAAFPYLPDVARLEQALRESYHAADATPLTAATLATFPEAKWLASRISFAPSLRLIRSAWPIHAIWLANTAGGPAPTMQAEDVLILRPEFDPHPHHLPSGGGAFLSQLLSGATMAEALAAAEPDFDLSALLTLLMNGNAIAGLSP